MAVRVTAKMAQSQTSRTLAILVGNPEKKHKVEAYEKVTARINQIAKRNWTWRYVQSVQVGSLKPSQKFVHAVSKLKIPEPPAPLSHRWWRELRRNAVRAMAKKTRQAVMRK